MWPLCILGVAETPILYVVACMPVLHNASAEHSPVKHFRRGNVSEDSPNRNGLLVPIHWLRLYLDSLWIESDLSRPLFSAGSKLCRCSLQRDHVILLRESFNEFCPSDQRILSLILVLVVVVVRKDAGEYVIGNLVTDEGFDAQIG